MSPSAVSSSESVPKAKRGRAGNYAIAVDDLGVQYNLRFTRKSTLRQSFANIVLRKPP